MATAMSDLRALHNQPEVHNNNASKPTHHAVKQDLTQEEEEEDFELHALRRRRKYGSQACPAPGFLMA